jgi:hypothetical protein
MGLTCKQYIAFFLTLICFESIAIAAWQMPIEVIKGNWGSNEGQFGLRTGDSGDDFPEIEAITPDGKIVISDIVNKKQLVFLENGNFLKEVKWTVKSKEGGRTVYDVPEYSFGPVVGYSSDGNIYTGSDNKYFLDSPTGQLLKTYTTRPSELGQIKTETLGTKKYRITIVYPEKTYILASDALFMKYVRDKNGNVYGANSGGVWRFNQCGKEIAELIIPTEEKESIPFKNAPEESITLDVEYGEPVVALSGDVYTWKKTDSKYAIVKWTWQDDPTVPSGPDAPSGLTVTPSTTGLYLAWTASAQDPGCVTGYEVARATSSGGVFSTVGTVDKGVVKYNDTTAEVGTMYYYKVRAKAGSEYSPYTAEVSGKR